jgi:Cu+-exporting ATPase
LDERKRSGSSNSRNALHGLRDVATSIELSRKTLAKIRQNLFWAFYNNVIMIPLAAGVLHPSLGVLIPPEAAATSMILSGITVVGNSMLLRRFKPQKK